MRYTYYLDGKKRHTTKRLLYGVTLKAREIGFDWRYSVFLEREDEPDQMFGDNDVVALTKKPRRFYTIPPCGGG